MALDYWSLICANVWDSEHNQTRAMAQLRSSVCINSLRGLQLMSNVVSRCVGLLVCVTLGPKAVSQAAWAKLLRLAAYTSYSAVRLMKCYDDLRLMKSTAAYEVYGSLWRRQRLGALASSWYVGTFMFVMLFYRFTLRAVACHNVTLTKKVAGYAVQCALYVLGCGVTAARLNAAAYGAACWPVTDCSVGCCTAAAGYVYGWACAA